MCLTRRSENRILPVHSVKKCHSALVRSACKSNTPVAHNVHADSRAGSVWTVSALLPLRCPCVSQSVRVIRVVGVILQRFYLYNTCTDVQHATVSSERWGVCFFFFFFVPVSIADCAVFAHFSREKFTSGTKRLEFRQKVCPLHGYMLEASLYFPSCVPRTNVLHLAPPRHHGNQTTACLATKNCCVAKLGLSLLL